MGAVMSIQLAKEYKHMLLDSVQGAIRRVSLGQNSYSCLALKFSLEKETDDAETPRETYRQLVCWLIFTKYQAFVTEVHFVKEWEEHKAIEDDFDSFFVSKFDDPKEARISALAAFKEHLEKLL